MTDREVVEAWRRQLLECWAGNLRATMTALLEDGPQYKDGADDGSEVRILNS